MVDEWRLSAACRDVPTDVFFPQRRDDPIAAAAAAICARCPVVVPCLEYARNRASAYGVWGGRYFANVTARQDGVLLGDLCKVPGCPKPVVARGWCRTHYQRWRVHGRPTDDEPIDPTRQRCATPGCQNFVNCRNLCPTCEKRADRAGDLTRRPLLGPLERFEARCVRTEEGCLLFQGGGDAYGHFVVGAKHHRPRRFAWENATGKTLPPGVELKARCRNPRCCEVSHLYVGV